MDAEVAALASSGATTLVGLMVSDAWVQARERLARFFGRSGAEGEAAQELRVSRAELVLARAEGDEAAAADIEAAWRTRLRRTLLADPAAAAELRILLAELSPPAAGTDAVVVHNSITGGTQYGPVVQGQNFSSLTFHPPAGPPPPPEPRQGC